MAADMNWMQLKCFCAGVCVGLTTTVFIVNLLLLQWNLVSRSGVTDSLTDLTDKEIDVEYSLEAMFRSSKHQGESELADALRQGVRVLCFVVTQPRNHLTKAMAVRATWGKRCTSFFFVSTEQVAASTQEEEQLNEQTEPLPPLDTALFSGPESRKSLWAKTRLGFQYAYNKYFEQADWFMKADDDTYVVMENLRLFLLTKNASLPVYYGCKAKNAIKTGYMSGGAGYVLSKEALKRFMEKPQSDECLSSTDPEDILMGKCLYEVGVETADSRDWEGQQRFFAVPPGSLLLPGIHTNQSWYWPWIWHPHNLSINCCSDSAISFHYIDQRMLWTMEYLIYHLHPFGIHPRLTGSKVKKQILNYLQHLPKYNISRH